MNILCGPNQSTKEVDYAGPGMVIEKMELAVFVDQIFTDIFGRMSSNPLLLVIPALFNKTITEADKRYF